MFSFNPFPLLCPLGDYLIWFSFWGFPFLLLLNSSLFSFLLDFSISYKISRLVLILANLGAKK